MDRRKFTKKTILASAADLIPDRVIRAPDDGKIRGASASLVIIDDPQCAIGEVGPELRVPLDKFKPSRIAAINHSNPIYIRSRLHFSDQTVDHNEFTGPEHMSYGSVLQTPKEKN